MAGASIGADFVFRYRVGGADNTTTNYTFQLYDVVNTSIGGARIASQDFGRLGLIGDTTGQNGRFVCNIFNPFSAKQKAIYTSGNRFGFSTSMGASMVWSGFTATTSFTGITLYASNGSQTFTGTYYIYGLAN